MKEEPPLSVRCRDKLLIQSTKITPEMETLPVFNIVSPPRSDSLFITHKLSPGFPFPYPFRATLRLRDGDIVEFAGGDTHSQMIRVAYFPPGGTSLLEEEEPSPGPPGPTLSPPEVSLAHVA